MKYLNWMKAMYDEHYEYSKSYKIEKEKRIKNYKKKIF